MNKNKRHAMFFVLFSSYVAVCLIGYSYIGEDVFYSSLPMVFGASIIYGYIAGFLAVILNIPAMILLMYAAGTPFGIAVRELNTFIILLQCVCVVIPGLLRLYGDKRDMRRTKESARKISSLAEEIETLKEEKDKHIKENDELKLIAERYRMLLGEQRDRDSLTGMLTREAVIRKAQKYLAIEKDKAYVFVCFRNLREINRNEGMFRGDTYLREKAAALGEMAGEAGRISGACFLLIEDVASADSLYKRISDKHGDEAFMMKVVPGREDRIEDIFKKWDNRIS